jgi:predicted transcriptional regulator of viral defense system
MKEEFETLQQYLEHLQSRGRYCFLRSDVIAKLCLSDNAFKKAAHRLMQKNKVIRIRGDFYTILPLEYRASGSLPASWFIDFFMKYLEQPYYCGLLTSAALHGAAHQQPMVFQVVTTKPMRPIQVNNLKVEFIYKKEIQPHFYQAVKTVTGSMNIATPEMTAFDLMRYINAAGQVNHVATVLCELVEKLNAEKLGALLKNDDVEITSAQRMGYLLDVLQLPIDLMPLENQLKQRKISRRLLVLSSNEPIIEYNQRWHILVNEPVEPDEL